MEQEFLQLAQEAVRALSAPQGASWVEIAQLGISGVGLVISGVGLVAILVGLKRMGEAGQRRDREIDEMAAAFRGQAETLGKIGEGITELLRRPA